MSAPAFSPASLTREHVSEALYQDVAGTIPAAYNQPVRSMRSVHPGATATNALTYNGTGVKADTLPTGQPALRGVDASTYIFTSDYTIPSTGAFTIAVIWEGPGGRIVPATGGQIGQFNDLDLVFVNSFVQVQACDYAPNCLRSFIISRSAANILTVIANGVQQAQFDAGNADFGQFSVWLTVGGAMTDLALWNGREADAPLIESVRLRSLYRVPITGSVGLMGNSFIASAAASAEAAGLASRVEAMVKSVSSATVLKQGQSGSTIDMWKGFVTNGANAAGIIKGFSRAWLGAKIIPYMEWINQIATFAISTPAQAVVKQGELNALLHGMGDNVEVFDLELPQNSFFNSAGVVSLNTLIRAGLDPTTGSQVSVNRPDQLLSFAASWLGTVGLSDSPLLASDGQQTPAFLSPEKQHQADGVQSQMASVIAKPALDRLVALGYITAAQRDTRPTLIAGQCSIDADGVTVHLKCLHPVAHRNPTSYGTGFVGGVNGGQVVLPMTQTIVDQFAAIGISPVPLEYREITGLSVVAGGLAYAVTSAVTKPHVNDEVVFTLASPVPANVAASVRIASTSNLVNQIGTGFTGGADYSANLVNNSAVTDSLPPIVASAVLGSDGMMLVVTTSEATVGADGFSVFVAGVSRAATWVRATPTTLVGTLASAAYQGQVVTLGYDAGSGTVVDGAGNEIVSFGNAGVTNNSAQTAPVVVATPTLSPASGSALTVGDEVEGFCATNGATVHYTLTTDGTTPADPTSSSPLYIAALVAGTVGTLKIKLRGVKAGSIDSAVASATYVVSAPSSGGGAGGVQLVQGPLQLTISEKMDGEALRFSQGERRYLALTLRDGDGRPLPIGETDEVGVTVTDKATGAVLTDNAGVLIVLRAEGRVNYRLQQADTEEARDVRLSVAVTQAGQGGDVAVFGPLLLEVRGR